MKNMLKKLGTLALTFVVMFSIVTNVFATTPGTITLHTGKHDVNDTEFKIYQLFSATVSGTNASYKINEDFVDFFNGKEATTDDAAYQYVKENVAKKDFQDAIKGYVTSKPVNASDSLIGETNKKVYQSKELKYGYYVMIPSKDTYALAFTTLSEDNQDVYLKGVTPGVEKTVEGGDDSLWDSAGIGETVHFKVESMVPNMTEYTEYHFQLTDTMTKGLTFDENSVAVYIGGETEAHKLTSDQYQIAGPNLIEGDKKQITITMVNFIRHKDKANEKLIFKYSAVLNESAIDRDKETNTANVAWGNTPGQVEHGKPDSVSVFTHQLEITKVDKANTNKKLQGAKFELYKVDNEQGEHKVSFVDLDNGNYRVANAEEASTVTEVVTPTNGIVNIKGLSAGQYKLKETKAPDGYNVLNETKVFNISAISNDNGQTVTVTGNKIRVENSAGILLPETGGMGTVLFTVVGVGGILAVLYSFMKSNKKNKLNENQ